MTRRHRIMFVVITLLACVGCDQQTKSLAREYLSGRDTVSYLDDTVRLDYTENQGAFLSLGASLPARWRAAVFTVGAGVGLAAILFYTLWGRNSGLVQVLGLSLICGGGLGNLMDRVLNHGYVRDFLNLGLGSWRTGIFNFADAALMTGCVLLMTRALREWHADAPR